MYSMVLQVYIYYFIIILHHYILVKKYVNLYYFNLFLCESIHVSGLLYIESLASLWEAFVRKFHCIYKRRVIKIEWVGADVVTKYDLPC